LCAAAPHFECIFAGKIAFDERYDGVGNAGSAQVRRRFSIKPLSRGRQRSLLADLLL
jgi:hypothetical protein